MPSISPEEDELELLQLDYMADRLGQLHNHLRKVSKGKWFHTKQMEVITEIFQKGKKRVFARKGRKGGGTHISLYPGVRLAGLFPNVGGYLIYPTLTLGKEIVWANNRLKNYFPPEWDCYSKENECRIVIPHTDGDSFVRVLGADNYKQMVGIEGDFFIFDELKDHDPRAYKNCYPNIASRDALWMVLGAPPKNKKNFYYITEQAAMKDPSWFCTQWSTWDNAANLPGGKEWIQTEKDAYYARGDWDEWEVEWEARYVLGGKRTVIPAFDKAKHAVPYDVIEARILQDKEKLRWYQIFDPGYATCFHVMFACINPYTSEVFILDEIHETDRKKLSVKQLWPRVLEKENALYKDGNWRRVYDSAAPGFPQEVRASFPSGRKYGFRPTYKEKDDEDTYFRIINTIFHTGRGLVAEHCIATIEEIENYLTDDSGNYPDENNHALDDFRYLLKADNYKLIEQEGERNILSSGQRPTTIVEAMSAVRKRHDWAGMIDDDIYCEGDDLW